MCRNFCGMILASLGCVFTAGSAPGQNWVSSSASPSNWLGTTIPVEARTHDFGTVARAAKTEHRFVLKNTTNQDLHLRSVRASCGCTTPIIESEWIKPGQEGTILARFNTGSFTGQKQATLTVSIDGPFSTELQLLVRGYIRSDVVLNPGEILFGQVSEGEGKVVEVVLDYAGRSDWQIEGVLSPLPFVSTDFEELSREAGRVQYKITAKLSDDAPVGFVKNQLILQTNDRRLTSVPVRLSADVQPTVQFSPPSIALGRVKPGEPVQQRLVIKSRKPFRILDISSLDAEVRYDPVEDSKPAHLVNIILAPNAGSSGKVDGHVILKTDLGDEPLKMELSYTMETENTPNFGETN